jgi:hypothetical protein
VLGWCVSAVGGGGGVVSEAEDWRVGLRLRLGVGCVVLEFELQVLVLRSLESAWGCGCDLVRELGLDLDLNTPILPSCYLWNLGFGRGAFQRGVWCP